MGRVRIGAVTYLNARPLVYGLEQDPRFDVRFDLPARCADLLHAGETDLGLIPSIEYLRGPNGPESYRVVPEVAITSRGTVASVAIFTTREMRDVRSVALDTSSRTSVALTRVMCARAFGITPRFEPHGPDLAGMLSTADAALIIGDNALFLEAGPVEIRDGGASRTVMVQKIDLGELWLTTTGLPFVYAFWVGRPEALSGEDVRALIRTRDRSLERTRDIAEFYYPGDPVRQDVADRYLRDNIKYVLGPDERAGVELFYRYAAETGVVPRAVAPTYYPDAL
ncbi:MAG: menaquinone biosynthesis protein [Acidobacteria bacterium]|nr:menaquinone biosynthesis protein [Acidobacteriota bacterium]